MRVGAGDTLALRVVKLPVAGTVWLYYELAADGAPEPTPALYSAATTTSSVDEPLSVQLAAGHLIAAAARFESPSGGAAGALLQILLRRRGTGRGEVELQLVSAHTNGRDWLSWNAYAAGASPKLPSAIAVNPIPVAPTRLEYTVPPGLSARLAGFQLSASIAAGTEASVVRVLYIFAGLVTQAAISTQLLQRPSSPTIVGARAPLSFPANASYVVVPLPDAFAESGTIIAVEIANPNPGDTLTGNAFGVELWAEG